MRERRRRLIAIIIALVSMLAGLVYEAVQEQRSVERPQTLGVTSQVSKTNQPQSENALQALDKIAVKGRAPKTGYERGKFSNGWGEIGGCSVRELILLRDLKDTQLDEDGCRVLSGRLDPDPYSGKIIDFKRGINTSQAVQIDHVVAVSDAWQKGAQNLTPELRKQFYNDPLNLLAVDGPTNNNKGDGDAATWLPPNKEYRCRYVARQIAVKIKYTLWITDAEKKAIDQVLSNCPGQVLPMTN